MHQAVFVIFKIVTILFLLRSRLYEVFLLWSVMWVFQFKNAIVLIWVKLI